MAAAPADPTENILEVPWLLIANAGTVVWNTTYGIYGTLRGKWRQQSDCPKRSGLVPFTGALPTTGANPIHDVVCKANGATDYGRTQRPILLPIAGWLIAEAFPPNKLLHTPWLTRAQPGQLVWSTAAAGLYVMCARWWRDDDRSTPSSLGGSVRLSPIGAPHDSIQIYCRASGTQWASPQEHPIPLLVPVQSASEVTGQLTTCLPDPGTRLIRSRRTDYD